MGDSNLVGTIYGAAANAVKYEISQSGESSK